MGEELKALEDLTKLNNTLNKDEPIEVPCVLDTTWPEFVMSHFIDTELDNGYPKVDGLRRVAEKLLGPIIVSEARVIQCPDHSNDFQATAEYKIIIDTKEGERIYVDAADANWRNVSNGYDKFAVAVAVTRAEARALRKALKLKTVAAEELGGVNEDTGPKITPNQLNMLDLMCRRLNVDVKKILTGAAKKANRKSAEDLSQAEASLVLNYLGKVQAGEGKVEESMLGYNSEWRN